MTSAQLRASRALLNWTVRQLAEQAGVHRNTVTNYETGKTEGEPGTVAAIRAVLESAGVILLADGETVAGGPGVRLRTGG
ncbi:helix-turn-helix transcriptional regulator [Mesorhizobium sp. M0802]|uniref:helix-turn-helix transcriptional regulator n=1 Tax=Mesorhizobium sp. M0802 TaxID=2957001 RepID=UPI003335921A